MIKKQFNILSLLFLFIFVANLKSECKEMVYIFPDRNSCVSGDTIWFDVMVFDSEGKVRSNMVHVCLSSKESSVTHSTVKCHNNWAHGYLIVPDSLSTGNYIISAFTNRQKHTPQSKVIQKDVLVYNRFDQQISEISMPTYNGSQTVNYQKVGMGISTSAGSLKTRGMAELKVEIPSSLQGNLKALVVNVGMADPLAETLPFYSTSAQALIKKDTGVVIENDAILIRGNVYNKATLEKASNVVVLLSISGTLPYFDYCIADSNGAFSFYLKNVIGVANLYIQVVSGSYEEYIVELQENVLVPEKSKKTGLRILANDQVAYINNLIDAAYYNRLFYQTMQSPEDTFSMDIGFRYPFYGEPTKIVYPELFIDLSDFTEIARELLFGVQYRIKQDHAIRVSNQVQNMLFDMEPLKLINGIPVFDGSKFSKLGTNQIERVELVLNERYFGDLVFKGVLAVYTKDKSNSWINMVPNMFNLRYECVQVNQKGQGPKPKAVGKNIPDFRQVLYHKTYFENDKSLEINFQASDIKGDVIIEVIGIGKENELYVDSKKITVQ